MRGRENRLWELVRRRPLHQQRWAVHDVTFDIHAGEVVGIIGRNGAGKTTLLRLISGVAPLDTGSIRVDASLQTILELGTGFHPGVHRPRERLSGRRTAWPQPARPSYSL